jgi:uncharacterized damage-inducible protein DinB
MPRRSLTIEQTLTILAETPPRIAALIADLTPTQLHTAPSQGEWSANDVLAHLRSCADVWGNCMESILAEDRPTIRAVNPTTWIKRTDYREQEFQTSWQTFVRQRAALLARLETLAPEAWQRAAVITGAGKPLERTVLFYAQWLARHERTHLKQFRQIADTMRA